MLRIIRFVATAIFTLIGLPFIVANIQRFLVAKHWDEFLLSWWPAMPDLTYFINATWVWVVLVFSGGVATALWIIRLWPENNGKLPDSKEDRLMPLQELYNQLDSIANVKNLNWHNVSDARKELNEWKVIAKRLIFRLFGQQELNNFLEKIDYIERRDEYCNADIGGIQAFLNEQDLYRAYLNGFLDSLEKHPELWS